MKRFVRVFMLAIFLCSGMQIADAQTLVVVHGFVTTPFPSQPVPGKTVHIILDSVSGAPAFSYADSVTTGANGYYIDSLWLPASALSAIVTVSVYDCMSILNTNIQMLNIMVNLPLINFTICQTANIDAGISHIISPASPFLSGSLAQVLVVARNYGLQPIAAGTLSVAYQLNNNTPVVNVYQGSILPNDSAVILLAPVILPAGNFTFCAYTMLPGDTNFFNDMQCITGTTIIGLPIPYSDNFDSLNIWTTDSTALWQRGAPNGTIINSAFSGTNAWVTNLNGNYPNSSLAYLYSPVFNFSGLGPSDTVTLSFHHWMAVADVGDYGQVQYTINGGLSWANMGFFGDPSGSNWYNTQSGGVHYFNFTNSGWMQSSYKLTPTTFNNQTVQFRFRFWSNAAGNSEGWAIDNIQLSLPMPQFHVDVCQIPFPINDTLPGTQINATITIRNYGLQAVSMVPVVQRINNINISSEVWTGSLLPGDSANYTFVIPYTVPAGPYIFCARTDAFFGPPGNNLLCRGFQGLPSIASHIYGMLNTGSGAAGPCLVYLIQHDSLTGMLIAIDSTFSIDSAGVTLYHFQNVNHGSYYVKAAMFPSNPNYAASIPSYHLSSVYWSQATPIYVGMNVIVQASIDFIQGINPGGPGFIGGLISQGANKGPGDPVEGVLLMLLDATNSDQPVAYTYSDVAGEFGFSNIPLGTYKVYAEMLNKTTFPAVVTVDANNPVFTEVNLVVGSSVISSVNEIKGLPDEAVGMIYPNPSAGDARIDLLLLQNATLNLEVMDITGSILRSVSLVLGPGNHTLNIETDTLKAGLYLVSLKFDDGGRVIRKLVKH